MCVFVCEGMSETEIQRGKEEELDSKLTIIKSTISVLELTGRLDTGRGNRGSS